MSYALDKAAVVKALSQLAAASPENAPSAARALAALTRVTEEYEKLICYCGRKLTEHGPDDHRPLVRQEQYCIVCFDVLMDGPAPHCERHDPEDLDHTLFGEDDDTSDEIRRSWRTAQRGEDAEED